MLIHKTHSKKDLCNIIKTFKLNIDRPEQYKKKQLLTHLKKEISTIEEIEPELDVYMFYNLIDLKTYLHNCNPKKLLSIKDKNDVIMKCKAITHYCMNNYNIDQSTFTSIDDLQKTVNYIQQYGDIPSVRKSCERLNKHPCQLWNIKPIISRITQKEIETRKVLKQKYPTKLIIKQGPFFLSFS